VSSAISCIVIKSDRLSGKVPLPGEMVHVEGRAGLFVVMHLDRYRNIAQLMERGGKHRLVNIPFSSVRPLRKNLAQVVRHFLESRDGTKGHRDSDKT
jgi:hypothetical protein